MTGVFDCSDQYGLLRQRAEKLVCDLGADPQQSHEILELVHELQVHQIELLMQNEELRQAQLALSELHEEYLNLYEYAPCGYITLSNKGIITRANTTAVNLLGTPEQHLTRLSFSQFVEPRWESAFMAARLESGSTGVKQSVELQLKTESKFPLWVLATVEAMRDLATDAVREWRVTLNDISMQKKAEQKNKEIEKRLRHAEKMESIGNLAGGVAHEFNNMLSIILGYVEVVLDENPEDLNIVGPLEEIRNAGMRASDVVRQLLAFSRYDLDTREPIHLATVVENTLKMIRSTIPANIAIETNIASDSAFILASTTRMNQVIINLCNNAKDAMLEKGGVVTVELSSIYFGEEDIAMHNLKKPSEYLQLVMRDTGSGMDVETCRKIFEPYFTTKEVGKGTGIGLAVVCGIVEGLDGVIEVESVLGEGTVFTIFLPSCEHSMLANSSVEKEIPVGTERILVVDDEPALVKLTMRYLQKCGYYVKGTTDPLEALKMFQDEPYNYDLLITDMAMPQMTGELLAGEVLKIRPNMSIVLCTGYSENVSAEKCHKAGISAFVMKPLQQDIFSGVIRDVLNKVS